MKLFTCQKCGQMLYFENERCEQCGSRLGYLPAISMLTALQQDGEAWRPLADGADPQVRFCANAEFNACNWLIPADSAEPFCLACRHNLVIPDTSAPDNLPNWRKLEQAKHRLFYALNQWSLPLANRTDDPQHGLGFEFLAETPVQSKILTGHENGIITIAPQRS